MTWRVLLVVALGAVLSDAVGAGGAEVARAQLVWADFDGDGLEDVYAVRPDVEDALLRNVGDGSFEDVTAQSLPCASCASIEVAWRDVDLDRRPDLLRLTVAGNVELLRNRGGGMFEDVTAVAGLERVSGASAGRWLDYDADGRADLELTTDSSVLLYHNLGDFLFGAVTLGAVDRAVSEEALPVRAVPGALDEGQGLPDERSAPVDDPDGSRRAGDETAALSGSLLADVHPDPLVATPAGDRLEPNPGTEFQMPPFSNRCAWSVKDTSTGDCVLTSTLPTLGKLYPISANLFVSTSGDVGIGTTSPAAKLDVAGTARVTDTLTLAPSGDMAIDLASGSLYKGGLLFFHSKGIQDNLGVGQSALANITTGFNNTAVGALALRNQTSGSNNTAVGHKARYTATGGTRNVAIGGRALYANGGSNNTAVGYEALVGSGPSSWNTAVGNAALLANSTGLRNTAVGAQALRSNTSSNFNTAIGYGALFRSSFGNYNTAVGARALFENTAGSYNAAMGFHALTNNTGGSFNAAMGHEALRYNTTGYGNSALGSSALSSNTTGYYNAANGEHALSENTTGDRNVATGNRALHLNTTGNRNTACGDRALFSNASGSGNTAHGDRALESNTIGIRNAASGNRSLRFNTTGNYNTAGGSSALSLNTTGSHNTAVGFGALYDNTTGNLNIALGTGAGSDLTTGDDNIAIGNAGVAGDGSTIRVGTPGTHTRAFLAGVHGVTTDIADGIPVLVDSNGQLGTVSSSRRFKKDIADMGDVTDRLLDLRPVVFRYEHEQNLADGGAVPLEYGLVAEEVAEIFPDLVVYDEGGVPFTVKYHLLSSMLLNEVKKLHEHLGAQAVTHAEKLASYDRKLEELQRRLFSTEPRDPSDALRAAASADSR